MALGAGAAAALPVYAVTDEVKPVVLAFAGGFLGALGVRGGVEGAIDHSRQENGDVKPGDVQPGSQGKV